MDIEKKWANLFKAQIFINSLKNRPETFALLQKMLARLSAELQKSGHPDPLGELPEYEYFITDLPGAISLGDQLLENETLGPVFAARIALFGPGPN